MAIERGEVLKSLFEGHAHQTHLPPIPGTNQWQLPSTSNSSAGGLGTALGASMALHPVGWAVGAAVAVGVVGVFLYHAFKEDKKDKKNVWETKAR